MMQEGKLPFTYPGTVIDNADPLKLARVRVSIPGTLEQSGWALPAGTQGGGKGQRGTWAPPPKDADVYVRFVLGDPDRPIYEGGHWGTGEAPTYVGTKTPATAAQVRVIETAKFEFIIDDAANKLIIRRKAGGEVLVGDEAADQPFVLGTTFKAGMESLFDLIIAHNHSTGVGPSSPPITAGAFTALKAQLSTWLSAFFKGK